LAEDAFQSAFLALAKRSRSLWVRDSVGPWLYRVAGRAAGRVRRDLIRRMKQERQLALRVTPRGGDCGNDRIVTALREEIDRLPAHYRRAVVACDVEELSYVEASQQMGWSVATVKGRLARGRERLRVRLRKRGLMPTFPLTIFGEGSRA